MSLQGSIGGIVPRFSRPRWIRPGQFFLHLVLLLGAAAMVFPFIWMTLSAFKTKGEIIAYPPVWIPSNPSFRNIIQVLTAENFDRY
jgi:multiple sugar transport system permease protein